MKYDKQAKGRAEPTRTNLIYKASTKGNAVFEVTIYRNGNRSSGGRVINRNTLADLDQTQPG